MPWRWLSATVVTALAAWTVGPAGAVSSPRAAASTSGGPVAGSPARTRPTVADLSISPSPGAHEASPRTQISVKGVPARRIRVIVVGSRSHAHSGRLLAYAAAPGASFLPSTPFIAGERVTVHLLLTGVAPVTYQFSVARPGRLPVYPRPARRFGPVRDVQSFRSRPDLRPPDVAVRTVAAGAAPGDVFVAPTAGAGQYGPMIFDSRGGLVWFDPETGGREAMDFRTQLYQGKPVLTWWQGYISQLGYGAGEEEIEDNAYRPIARVRAGNGYLADLHEFQLTAQGTALITAFVPEIYDDSALHGGRHNDVLMDGVMQEIDVRTGLVMFEWHSLDHIAASESHSSPSTLAGYPFDYFHINSIQDVGSNYLISARNTWADYLVDGHNGAVLWRLGGRRSDFSLGPGTAFAWAHDARMLPDGDLSEFDDGALPAIHKQSRGIVVHLDRASRRATLVKQYEHPQPLLAGSQGNYQTLLNGDPFLGWGAVPYFSEFSPAGQLLFDAKLPRSYQSYRGYREVWTSLPAGTPALAVVRGPQHHLIVYASWNGATNVASWQVLAGPQPRLLSVVGSGPRTGFESAIKVDSAGRLIAVRAISPVGHILGTSRVISP